MVQIFPGLGYTDMQELLMSVHATGFQCTTLLTDNTNNVSTRDNHVVGVMSCCESNESYVN